MSYPPRPLEPRFWSRTVTGDGCWAWTGTVAGDGYGTIKLNGRAIGAHRASWLIHHGSIPEGRWVLHTCDNPLCVNPAHLWLGGATDNARDRQAKGRGRKRVWSYIRHPRPRAVPKPRAVPQLACIRGHAFTPDNTKIRGNGTRCCRACNRIRAVKYLTAMQQGAR